MCRSGEGCRLPLGWGATSYLSGARTATRYGVALSEYIDMTQLGAPMSVLIFPHHHSERVFVMFLLPLS